MTDRLEMNQHFNLDAYRGEKRLLLIFAPSQTDAAYVEQRNWLKQQVKQMDDYDLLVFHLFGEEPGHTDGTQLPLRAAAAAREQFKVNAELFALLLIGKDGKVKLRVDRPVPLADVFALIDVMPSPQQETQ
jgi:hypothetical protein